MTILFFLFILIGIFVIAAVGFGVVYLISLMNDTIIQKRMKKRFADKTRNDIDKVRPIDEVQSDKEVESDERIERAKFRFFEKLRRAKPGTDSNAEASVPVSTGSPGEPKRFSEMDKVDKRIAEIKSAVEGDSGDTSIPSKEPRTISFD